MVEASCDVIADNCGTEERHLSPPTMLRVLSRTAATQRRAFATVSSSIIAQPPHPPPPPEPGEDIFDIPPLLDAWVLQAAAKPHKTSISEIVKQYLSSAGTVLDITLPYEPMPSEERRPRIGDVAASCRDVVTIAHCARDGLQHKVTLASGFALNVKEGGEEGKEETLIVTCAHALEEVSARPLGYGTGR